MVFRNLAVRTGQNFQSDVFLQPHVLTLEAPSPSARSSWRPSAIRICLGATQAGQRQR